MMLCADMAHTKEFRAGGSFFDNLGGVLKELVARALGSAAATGQMRILARSAARTGLVARGMATIALKSLSNSLGSRLKTVLVRGGSRARPHPAVSLPEAFPDVDLAVADPIADILDAPAFQPCIAFFAANEAIDRALVSPVTQALLFTLVRNLRPEHVIEIGTYKASTTEAICLRK
jgi:hypothetical protein